MYRNISITRLKELMGEYGYSQQDVITRTGIPKSTMSMYLSGKRGIDQDRLAILADLFNTNEAYLMGLDVPKHKLKAVDIFSNFPLNSEQIKKLVDDYSKLEQSDKDIVSSMVERLSSKNK